MTKKNFNRLAKAIGITLALVGVSIGVGVLVWLAPMVVAVPITTGLAIVWLVYVIYNFLKREGE